MKIIGKASLLFVAVALVACQSTETPDTTLQGASDSQLHARMQTTCMATQAKLGGGGYDQRWPGCECYATRTIVALDAGEKDYLRREGVFNESASQKALASIDVCKLKRP